MLATRNADNAVVAELNGNLGLRTCCVSLEWVINTRVCAVIGLPAALAPGNLAITNQYAVPTTQHYPYLVL